MDIKPVYSGCQSLRVHSELRQRANGLLTLYFAENRQLLGVLAYENTKKIPAGSVRRGIFWNPAIRDSQNSAVFSAEQGHFLCHHHRQLMLPSRYYSRRLPHSTRWVSAVEQALPLEPHRHC